MATAPNVIVAGHPDLARKLRNTGRFPAVFDVASATALRELSQSGRVAAPATFMFGPDFDEDLPDAGVVVLANGLAASGFAVLVHSVFSERGDVFDPRVMADTGPLTMAQLLDLLSMPDAPVAPVRGRPAEPPPPPPRELLDAPPPTAWATPAPMPGQPVPAEPRPKAAPAEEPPLVPDAGPEDPTKHDPPEDGAENKVDAGPPEDEEEDLRDVPVAGEQGPADSHEQEALPEYEHDHRDVAETRAEPLPFLPAETPAEPFSPDPAGTVTEPQSPAEWMWKETAPEPDHFTGPPPETDQYEAMAPGTGWQGGPAPAQGAAARAGSRRRGTVVLMVAAVFVLLAALMAAAVLAFGPGKEEHPEAATSAAPSPDSPAPASPGAESSAPTSSGAVSQVPTSTPTAVRPAEQYKPTGVRIVDSRVSIEVSWKDASGGKAAYYVVGGPAGQRPSTLANTKQGATKVVVAALNPSVEYCLTVVAVVDVDRVAYAKPVCTHRGKREG
jgi:hypothetical protein